MTEQLAAGDALRAPIEELMLELARGAEPERTGEVISDHLEAGGKRLRAVLAAATARALGAGEGASSAWGAACELLHNATLIHDDIQDEDAVRRGRPTAWKAHGLPLALNAGDLLFLLPFAAIERVDGSPEVRQRLVMATVEAGAAVIRGQTSELLLHDDRRADRAEYEAAVRGKTSALFWLPVFGGVALAGEAEETCERWARPFRELGVVFQLQDDLLDLYGNKGREAVGSDIKEGKVSALVVEHLELHPGDREWLWEILETPRGETTDAVVTEVIARFSDGGARAGALARLEDLLSRGHRGLDGLPEPLVAIWQELAERVTTPIAHLR